MRRLQRNIRFGRGFTMTEMIGVLGLMAVLLFLATRLFHTSVRYAHQSAEAGSEANRIEAIVMKFHNDAWTATTASASGVELTLTEPGERVAKWSVAADGTLSRSVQQGKRTTEQQRWPEIAKGWSFSINGPEIVVKDPLAGELRLVMQLKLLEKAP